MVVSHHGHPAPVGKLLRPASEGATQAKDLFHCGIHDLLHLLAGWSAQAERAVMVGDYLFDLLAGRLAGTMTVLVDPEGRFEHAHAADACVERLDLLIAS